MPITLLPLAMFLRYKKQSSIVGCLRYLEPHEQSAYLTLQIIFAFLIDMLLGIKDFSILILFSIILTLLGVFMIADTKLKIKALQKDLLLRIFTSLLLGYITHYILLYWSNALYLLLSNLLLTILFSKKYKLSYHKKEKIMIKRVFLVQIFGFLVLYLSNYLITKFVTLSSYVKPVSITFLFFITLFLKNKDKKINIKQIIALIFIIFGISKIR